VLGVRPDISSLVKTYMAHLGNRSILPHYAYDYMMSVTKELNQLRGSKKAYEGMTYLLNNGC
jgi:alpha-glucosidase (family GH31 glycosyl hydrolase)